MILKKTLGVSGVLLLIATALLGQGNVKKENSWELKSKIDFLTRHYWRGGISGNAPSIEPSFELSKNNFSFGMWFAATVDDKYKEMDIFFYYSPFKNLTIGINDQYNPNGKKLGLSKWYHFGKDKTVHQTDFELSYNLGFIPLKLNLYTAVLGKDYDTNNNRRFSTYLQATYSQQLFNKYVLDAIIAGTPHKSMYAEKAEIITLEAKISRTFQLKKGVKMPIFGRFIHNPHTNENYIVGGLTFVGLSQL